MGNMANSCTTQNILTNSFSMNVKDSTCDATFDPASPIAKKPKALRPKRLPPVKTMKDL